MLEGLIHHSKTKELTFRDGIKVFYREWKGAKDGDVVIYLHGLESHAGWFLEMGNLLNRKGFHVYGVDRRGSGLNHSERGHMESYWALVDDVKEIIEKVKNENPNRKIYLIGLCWGGKIAVTYSALYGNSLDGLILITPAIKTRVDLTLTEKLDVIVSNVFHPRKLLDIPLDERIFTKDPKYADFIKKDELKLKKVTARFFFETGMMNFHFDRIARKIKIPTLALLAGDDVVVDNAETKKWFKRLGSRDKTIKTYENCWHSLLFEDPRNPADYLACWIKTHTTADKG